MPELKPEPRITVVACDFRCVKKGRSGDTYINEHDLITWLLKSELASTSVDGRATLRLVREQIEKSEEVA